MHRNTDRDTKDREWERREGRETDKVQSKYPLNVFNFLLTCFSLYFLFIPPFLFSALFHPTFLSLILSITLLHTKIVQKGIRRVLGNCHPGRLRFRRHCPVGLLPQQLLVHHVLGMGSWSYLRYLRCWRCLCKLLCFDFLFVWLDGEESEVVGEGRKVERTLFSCSCSDSFFFGWFFFSLFCVSARRESVLRSVGMRRDKKHDETKYHRTYTAIPMDIHFTTPEMSTYSPLTTRHTRKQNHPDCSCTAAERQKTR